MITTDRQVDNMPVRPAIDAGNVDDGASVFYWAVARTNGVREVSVA
jgi:hypothetical protein